MTIHFLKTISLVCSAECCNYGQFHPEISNKQVANIGHMGSAYNRPQAWGIEVVYLGLNTAKTISQLLASGAIACPADITHRSYPGK